MSKDCGTLEQEETTTMRCYICDVILKVEQYSSKDGKLLPCSVCMDVIRDTYNELLPDPDTLTDEELSKDEEGDIQ